MSLEWTSVATDAEDEDYQIGARNREANSQHIFERKKMESLHIIKVVEEDLKLLGFTHDIFSTFRKSY